MHSLVNSGKYIQQTQTEIVNGLAYELSYFGDYNGDGIADLIISEKVSKGITLSSRIHFFKYNKSSQTFVLDKLFDLNVILSHNYSQQNNNCPRNCSSSRYKISVIFGYRIDFDGKVDLILLFKSGTIQIHYNTQPNSQIQLIMSEGYQSFPYDLYQSENSAAKIQRLKPTIYLPSSTSTLLFGDFNLDGFDDLIIDY